MRAAAAVLVLIAACGGSGASPDATIDGPPAKCQPVGATGQVFRDPANPHLLAGKQFSDGKIDLSISDPDLHYDDATSQFELYYATGHGSAFSDPAPQQMIRHATSPDAKAWSVDDAPVLVAADGSDDWDHINTETPSVAVNPDADADHRFLMVYSGANGAFQTGDFPGYAIGAAFSADGVSFTRISATDSPHAEAGLVLTGADAYPTATGAIVADPEVIYLDGTYHLWFSSFACDGAGTGCTATNFGIGHATSTDGIHWTVAEAPVKTLLRAAADKTSGGGQPSVIYDDAHCRFEMWLTSDADGDHADQPVVFNNSAGFWHATSLDGVAWTISFAGDRDLSWDKTRPGEHLGLLTGADVAARGQERFMVYVGFDDQNVPGGFFLPDATPQGFEPGVMALDLATRDVK